MPGSYLHANNKIPVEAVAETKFQEPVEGVLNAGDVGGGSLGHFVSQGQQPHYEVVELVVGQLVGLEVLAGEQVGGQPQSFDLLVVGVPAPGAPDIRKLVYIVLIGPLLIKF